MRTAFRDVKEDIRRRILAGDWAPGDLLPNEVDLAVEFRCARATVNRAVRELAEEGLVERKRKAGTRVRRTPVRTAQFEIPFVRNEVAARGQEYRYELTMREAAPAPKPLRARMSLAEGARALHLHCIHYAQNAPYQFEDRWINLGALPAAEAADFSLIEPSAWLVGAVPFSDAEISFSAISADGALADALGCRLGDPLFLTERSTWWRGDAITYVRLVFQSGYRVTTRY